MLNPQNIDKLITNDHELLLTAIKRAGTIARGLIETKFESWDKAKGDPVTEVGLALDAWKAATQCTVDNAHALLHRSSPPAPGS